MDRLLAAAALEVDRRSRHLDRQFRIEHDVAGDVHRLLGDLAHAAENQMIDLALVQRAAFEQRGDDMRPQRDRMLLAQPALTPAQWRANGVYDYDIVHGV